MAQGPILIFDKSSLESLNLDEAVLLDNFYMSNITPLFFVECLADLEKAIKSRSTPEQLVGSLATRTPEAQACANIHHQTILQGELTRHFDLTTGLERPLLFVLVTYKFSYTKLNEAILRRLRRGWPFY